MRPVLRRFAEPLLLTALTISGLVAALSLDGVLKAFGVLLVAAPVAAILRHWLRSTRLKNAERERNITSTLSDPRAAAVLVRLHAEDSRQFRAMARRYLPQVILSPFTGRSGVDVSSPAEAAFLRDKLVALDSEKGCLAYMLCRALNARRVVEIGTSFGVSTIYLAAAMRDNSVKDESGGCMVIGTEIEPDKVAAARMNLAASGLEHYVEIRMGDALMTLMDLDEPVDFVLIDTWIPIALPALKLLKPRLRPGAIIMCDNVRQFAKEYREYTDFVRNRSNGFCSMLWPGQGGIEVSRFDNTVDPIERDPVHN